jgi:hypothetical protein
MSSYSLGPWLVVSKPAGAPSLLEAERLTQLAFLLI